MSEAMIETMITTEPPSRTRRGKKRLVFQPPRQMPRSVGALWEGASPEEKARAHRSCVAILSMWLGRKTRAAVAQELELPPLRVWQMSQSALSGMLAGLLKQPRGRSARPEPSEEDPRALKKRIAELEAENDSLRTLVEILRNLPSARETPAPRPRKQQKKKPQETKRARKRQPTEVQRRSEADSGTAAQDTGQAPPR